MIDFWTLVVLCFISSVVGYLIAHRNPVVKTVNNEVARYYVPYALLMHIPNATLHDNGGIVVPLGEEKYHITDDGVYQIITKAGIEDEVEADPDRVLAYAEKTAPKQQAQSQKPKRPYTRKKKAVQPAAVSTGNGNGATKLPHFLRKPKPGHHWVQEPTTGDWVELPL